MMQTNKETFLHTLSKALGRETIPERATPLELPNDIQQEYYRGTTSQALKELFIEQSRTAGTLVHECGMETLNDTIMTVASELGEGPILLADDPLLQQQRTAAAVGERYTKVHTWNSNRSREKNINWAESAGIGIAVAQLALAETGTVMMYGQKGCGRAVTLLPTTTIFIILSDSILPRLTQSMAWLADKARGNLPSSVNYISGASSTADIELVRVQGVHGPIQIAYIVIS